MKTLHGIAFLDRQSDNSGKPNEVNVQVSVDSTSWTDAGTFNLQNTKGFTACLLTERLSAGKVF